MSDVINISTILLSLFFEFPSYYFDWILLFSTDMYMQRIPYLNLESQTTDLAIRPIQ